METPEGPGISINVRDQAREVTRAPVIVPPDASLRDVARRLWEQDVSAAVVGTDTAPVGVVSEHDIVVQLALGADPDAMTVDGAMTPRVIAARPHDPLLDVAYLMLEDVVRHVPLVDEDGTVQGMVSMPDLLRPLIVNALGG